MKITLLWTEPGIVTLTEEGITIGRGDAATLRVASNAVSRVHAKFFLKDGKPTHGSQVLERHRRE